MVSPQTNNISYPAEKQEHPAGPPPTSYVSPTPPPSPSASMPLPSTANKHNVRLMRRPTPPAPTFLFPAKVSCASVTVKPRVVSGYAHFASDRRLGKTRSSMSRTLSNHPRQWSVFYRMVRNKEKRWGRSALDRLITVRVLNFVEVGRTFCNASLLPRWSAPATSQRLR